MGFSELHHLPLLPCPSKNTAPKSLLKFGVEEEAWYRRTREVSVKATICAISLLKTPAGYPSFLVLPLAPQCSMSYMG